MKRRIMGGAPRALLALAVAGLGAAPASARALPFFQEVQNAFGTQPCANAGCWTNYLRVTDIDGDGDLDVLFPNADGYFNKGTPSPFVIYKNDGKGNFTNVSQSAVGGFTGYLRQVAVGDVDGDGDPDIYAPSAWGDPDALFINDGKGVFKDEAAARNPGVASHAGAARFGDVDNDGDLDLLISDGWAQSAPVPAHLYLNDGTGHFSEATGALPGMVGGAQPIDFDLFDADRDFDLDVLINLHTGPEALWLNDGAGHFTAAPLPPQGGSLKYGPGVCDVDGDGDLDIWIDNAGPNESEQLLINDGTAKFTDETATRVKGNLTNVDDNGVLCADVDGDGDLDAVVASLSNQERVLINDGTGKFSLLPGGFSMVNDSTLWLELGDMNGDGRLDAVTGQGESKSFLNRFYAGTAAVPVDVRPPLIIKVEPVGAGIAPDKSPVVRFAVSDNTMSDEGPRLKRAYLKITTPAASEVEARFMGGDLFRGVLPEAAPGATVTFAACATDRQGNSACGPAETYTVADPSSGSSSASSSSASASSSASGSGGASSSSASGSSAGSGGGSSSASASSSASGSDGASSSSASGSGAGSGSSSGGGSGGASGSGVSSSASASNSGAGTGSAGVGGSGVGPSPGNDSGCGCRATGGDGAGRFAWLVLAAIAAARRRRGGIAP